MAFAGRSLSDAELKKYLAEQGAGGGSWGVERLALAAAFFHGDVRVARAEAEVAAASIKTAGQIPNPVLSFSPGYNSTTSGISPWIIAPSLDVTIETAGKRGKRLASARAAAEAARLRVSDAAWNARTKVRAAMLDLHAARENSALLNAEVALHDEAVKKLGAQVKAGESPAFELIQERLGLNRSKLALHDAEKLAATSKAQLSAAVGISSTALDAVTLDFSAFASLPPAPAANVRRRALTHRADLLAALAGIVAEVNGTEGQRVEKGAILFRLDSRAVDAAAQTELATAKVHQSLLRGEAPLSGTLVRFTARPGEAADATTVLAEIVDLDRLVASLRVPRAEAADLKAGQKALLLTTRDAQPVEGSVVFVSPQVDAASDTIAARVSVPKGSGLQPGTFVAVRIIVEERAGKLAVPRAAIYTDHDGRSTLSIVEDGVAKQRIVKTGLRDGDLVEVEGEGVSDGATVVTLGSYALPKETKVRVLGEVNPR